MHPTWHMARLEGFEPPAHGLEVRSSIHLSYRRLANNDTTSLSFRQDENHQSLSASPLLYLHPTRRSDLYAPTKKRAFVRPIPLTVAIMTQVFFFSPISLFILYLIYQFRMISMTTRTKGPVLCLPQPQTIECRNQKMASTTHHKIVRILAATDRYVGPALR